MTATERKRAALAGPPSTLNWFGFRSQPDALAGYKPGRYCTPTAIGSWIARNSRGRGKNMVSVTVATVSTSIV